MTDTFRFYRIGRPLFALASAALDEVEMINAARPVLAELGSATGETSYFGVVSGEKLVVLAKHDGSGSIRINDRIGKRPSPALHGARESHAGGFRAGTV